MKTIFILMVLVFAAPVMAADVTLQVVVPDAWVQPTIDAVNSTWPGREVSGMTNKQWTEYQIRQWLKRIVAPYKSRIDREAALDAAGYNETMEGDVFE